MTTQPIDLDSRLDAAHLSVLKALPPDLLDLSDITRTRAGLDALLGAMPVPELPAGVAIEDRLVPGLDAGPDVVVRTYRPDGVQAGGPAFYWIHGGGMVLGSVDMSDLDCATRAADFGCLVASVEYRLAPEHPFPAPLDDCYAGLSWLAANAADLGVDPARIVIGGGSAGGGLAAGLALMARDRGGPSIAFQFLQYPMLDHRNDQPSTHAITDPRVWNRDANRAGWDAYLGEASGGGDVSPLASPAVADDLSGLPPAYINVGQFDLFLDEDIAYAQALLRAGVACELRVYPGAFHGSNSFVSESALSKRWRADEDAALLRALFPG
jgi:acetyl esterase/lipase